MAENKGKYLAVVAVISLGDMGSGIARLLKANGFRVVTSVEGRSEYTIKRAEETGVECLSTDADLVRDSDYILSIVPPRDSQSIAQRIVTAFSDPSLRKDKSHPLYFLDLNAISPLSMEKVKSAFDHSESIIVMDGAILGGPPRVKTDGPSQTFDPSNWYRPSVVLSGPDSLSTAPVAGPSLFNALNGRHINARIGAASGLKNCFASINKGLTGIAIQAYATAASLGISDELSRELHEMDAEIAKKVERGIVSCAPKAYRWVREMEEIAETFREYGGFASGSAKEKGQGGSLFEEMAGIYRFIADDTPLGAERVGHRTIGTTAREFADECGKVLRKDRET